MSEWMPIESAPRDGTEVILYEDGSYGIGRWVDTSHQEQRLISSKGRRETYEWFDVKSGYWEDTMFAPTHWMPLPEPPKP